jgi:hypothetical protein
VTPSRAPSPPKPRRRRAPAPFLALAAAAWALGSRPAEAREPVPFDTVLDRVERHAVVVVVRFRKDVEADAHGTDRADPDSTPEVFRRWRMSLRVPGFVVRDRRTVLVSDLFLPRGSVASVEVVGKGRDPVPARLSAFLPHCGATVVETASDLAAEPVPFPETVAVTARTPLFVGSVGEGLRGDEVWAESLGSARRRAFVGRGFSYGTPERASAGLSGSRMSRTADLVVREDGLPLGFRFGASVDLEESVWTGPEILEDLRRAFPFSGLEERAAATRRSDLLVPVRLTYRVASDDDGGSVLPFAYAGLSDDAEPDDHAVHYGVAVAPDRVVVPASIPDAWVRRIESVAVEDAEGGAHRGTFEGRLRGLGAFVVRVEPALATSLPPRDEARTSAPPGPENAFLVHRVAFRAGARRDRVDMNRSLGEARGHGDRRYLASEEAVPAGAFLLDLDGEVLGFACDLLPEDVDAEVPGSARPTGARGSRGVVAALFAERGGPAALAAGLDRRVLPAQAEEARRLPWLGVEHEGLDRRVAEALGVSGPTLDGARGRIVTLVYPSSPASRAGLREDDVLLTARRTGGSGAGAPPVDLRDGDAPTFASDGGDVPRLWRPRLDGIVRLLDSWGEGAPYEVAYVRDGAVRTVPLVVERAPRDWSSARRARDDAVGVTVREVTYEVRAALRMAGDAPGVVVSRVDEGSPAARARLQPNEILREADGRVLTSPDDFAAALAAARAAGRPSVRVVVLRLNRSRFVDLDLVVAPGSLGSPAKGD